MLKMIGLMVILLALGGCGKKNKKDDLPVDKINLGKKELFSEQLSHLTLDSKAPNGVGAMLVFGKKALGHHVNVCTWFLIDEDMAVTSSRCIPNELKNDDKIDCATYLQGAFSTSDGMKKVRCQKIIYASPVSAASALSSDYALIKLEAKVPGVKIFPFERIGLSDDQKVKVLSMTHYQSDTSIYSEYTPQTCLIKSSDILGQIQSKGSNPLAGFKAKDSNDSCKSVNGNSGAPVVDSNHKLLGLLNGGIESVRNSQEMDDFAENQLASDVVIITNFRCLKFHHEVLDKDIAKSCSSELKQSKRNLSEIAKEHAEKLEKKIEIFKLSQPSIFEYEMEMKSSGKETLVSFLPKCILPLNQWNEEFLKKIKKKGFIFKKKSLETSINQFQITPKITLDYYGVLKLDLTHKKISEINLKITGIEKLKRLKKVSLTAPSSTPGQESVTQILPQCSQENDGNSQGETGTENDDEDA